jgi:hypothetical protein
MAEALAGVREAGLCVPEASTFAEASADREAGGVCRRMLLAWVSEAFHQAAGQCGVLAREDRAQQDARPARQPHAAKERMARDSYLGT